MMKKTILLSLIFLTACSSIGLFQPTPTPTEMPCSVQAQEFKKQIDDLHTEWIDLLDLAENTSRIALSPVIDRMQGVRRATKDLTPPDCAYFVQYYFIQHQDAMLQGILLFMADTNESEASYQIRTAAELLDKFNDEFHRVLDD